MSLRRTCAVGAVTAVAVVLAGCGGWRDPSVNGGVAADGNVIGQLSFPAEADNSVGGLANYNPLAAKPLVQTGYFFEPLIVRNNLSCSETPWLATGKTWTGSTKLTFDIRQGVTWSDGQPFTAKDVAFTFNLGKQYPAADKAGIWSDTFGGKATSVVAEGTKVVLTFSGPAVGKYEGIIKTFMLPEHVYGKVGDPTKYIDKAPVGTGMFLVDTFNGRRLTMKRNPDYWQADKVKVQKVVLEGTFDASSAALKLRAGQLDAYWGEIPNPEKTFVAADPRENKFWYAPNGSTVLTTNTTQKPFSDVKFRQAMSYAMDKESMSLKATYGIMDPASQTGLKLPYQQPLLPSTYTAQNSTLPYDPAKAGALLDAAGYAKGADGFRTNPDGSPLALNFTVQAGFIDYLALADVVAQGLNAAGVRTKVTASSARLRRPGQEDGRLPDDVRVPLRRLRRRPRARGEARHRPDPDEDRHLPQRRAVDQPVGRLDGRRARQGGGPGDPEVPHGEARRDDDDAVPRDAVGLRPVADPLHHQARRGVAVGAEPLRQPERRQAAHPHPPHAGAVTGAMA